MEKYVPPFDITPEILTNKNKNCIFLLIGTQETLEALSQNQTSFLI